MSWDRQVPRDSMGRRVGRRKMYIGLGEYIIRNLGRVPITSREVYNRVCDDYGTVNRRVFWRHLKKMADARKIRRIIALLDDNRTHLYTLNSKAA